MTANQNKPVDVYSNRAEPSNNFSYYNLASNKDRRETDIDQITNNHESLKVVFVFESHKILQFVINLADTSNAHMTQNDINEFNRVKLSLNTAENQVNGIHQDNYYGREICSNIDNIGMSVEHAYLVRSFEKAQDGVGTQVDLVNIDSK